MRKNLHPDTYRTVVFQDRGANTAWLMQSTVATDRTIVWDDGVEYPLFTVEISSASHPFYTGTQRLVDAEGRVDKFNRRYNRAAKEAL